MTYARYRVRNVENLKRLVNKGVKDYFIALGPKGALRSSKHVTYDGKIFYVLNEIDSSEQELTEAQLNDPNETNIGEAIKKGAFIAESDDEKIFEEA